MSTPSIRRRDGFSTRAGVLSLDASLWDAPVSVAAILCILYSYWNNDEIYIDKIQDDERGDHVSPSRTGIKVRPMAGSLGAEITGVDVASLDDEVFEEIQQAFRRHLVVALREQDISPQEHLDYAARWGPVLPHPYVPSIEGYPGVMKVYDPTPITQTWHADFTYSRRPPKMSILVARTLPPVGGDTMFANQHAAYDSLSAKLQEVLVGLRAVHRGTSLARESGLSDKDVEWTHPVVRRHPETGRRSLFVNADYTKHFEGMTVEESGPLLAFLYQHATRPEFTCRHRWQDGDILMWDNRAVQHAVIGDVGGAERVLHRVTIEGDEPR